MIENKIAIMTDSGCDLPDEMLREYGISMISLRISFKEGEYRDRTEITAGEVYARLNHEQPHTSLPHTCDILALFGRLVVQGYTDVIYIAISSGLSGTKNLVEVLGSDYPQLRVHVYDSKALSFEQGYLALEAAQCVQKGWDVPAILAHIQNLRSEIFGMFVVRTLEYLKKGGRIGRVEGTLGTLLDIKPVIGLDSNGVYYGICKARGFKRALRKMVDSVREKYHDKLVNLAVVHGGTLAEAQQLANELKACLHIRNLTIAPVSPVLGAHSGPGLLGIVAYETP